MRTRMNKNEPEEENATKNILIICKSDVRALYEFRSNPRHTQLHAIDKLQ